jgi:hypothetical protein
MKNVSDNGGVVNQSGGVSIVNVTEARRIFDFRY